MEIAMLQLWGPLNIGPKDRRHEDSEAMLHIPGYDRNANYKLTAELLC